MSSATDFSGARGEPDEFDGAGNLEDLDNSRLGRDLLAVSSERQPAADSHPARVYLLRLAPSSRPVMRGALQIAAELLTSGQCTWESMPWSALRIQHMDALRSELANRYASATANRMLAAVRGTMRAAWELGQMDTDSYQRALSTRSVRGETLPRGRAISQGELRALFAAWVTATKRGS